MDFGAGAAGTDFAHLPEIVLLAATHDPIRRENPFPQSLRFVVVLIHRSPEPILRKSHILGEKLPRKLDGLLLIVIPERPVAQHFKKGVMRGVPSDLVQIVVLARHADAFLGRNGPDIVPLFPSQEDILELIHPRIGEQQGGVVVRDHRPASHKRVIAMFKIA